jgi:hypothetical protein
MSIINKMLRENARVIREYLPPAMLGLYSPQEFLDLLPNGSHPLIKKNTYRIYSSLIAILSLEEFLSSLFDKTPVNTVLFDLLGRTEQRGFPYYTCKVEWRWSSNPMVAVTRHTLEKIGVVMEE